MHLMLVVPLCLLALTPLAQADVYQFTFQGTEGACGVDDPSCSVYNAQWQLSSMPDSSTSITATYDSVSVTNDGGLDSGPFYTVVRTDGSFGQEIDFEDPDFRDTVLSFSTFMPDTFFSGPTSSPTYLAGTYGASLYSQGLSDSLYGTAVITDLSDPSSVTPEPSSLILLGSGMLGVAGVVRRRLA